MSRAKVGRRSPCPVAATLDILGERWSLVIIRDLFARYHEVAASPEGIATNILASRLEKLTEAGIIAASAAPDRAGSSAYTLTKKGRELLPILGAMRDWGLRHVPGTEAKIGIPQ